MNRSKRFLSVLLSLCLLLGLLPGTAFAASGDHPFTDVPDGAWYSEAVQYVYEHGLMNGTSPTKFSPDTTTSRGMIVTILHRMEGTPRTAGTSFTDVLANQYYTEAVAWASANRIVTGYGNGKFGPNDPITREQLAAILYRYVQYKHYYDVIYGDASVFADGNKVSAYAVDAVDWAVGMGLLSGTGSNMLTPAGAASRAQVATILMRFCENVVPDEPEEPDFVAAPYTVTFALNYPGAGNYSTAEVWHGFKAAQPADPSRTGYTFDGWYTEAIGGEKFDFESLIFGDKTLYAHWTEIPAESQDPFWSWPWFGPDTPSTPSDGYTVTFDSNGGSAVDSQIVSIGARATMPDDPEREGFVFMGWHGTKDRQDYFDFENTAIYSNITIFAQWVDAKDTTDTDGDGLTNPFEYYFGTDKDKFDTDDDGLNDYFELYVVNTNPLNNDTDKNGITDNLEDADDDRLSNGDECAIGTNAIYYDTDHDLLSDYDEVYIYGTNPLVADTDGDGVTDGDEIAIGSNPLIPEMTFTTEIDFGEPTEDNPVSIKVDAVTDSEGAGTLEVEAVMRADNYLVSDSIAGYLGYAYNIVADGELSGARLTFSYDESLGTIGDDFQPRIYYLNEKTCEWEELPNQTVMNGQIIADTTHFSTYILLNKVEFDDVWNTEIEPPFVNDDGSDATLDIAFVIDYSASMYDNDGRMLFKQLCKEFISKLRDGKDSAAVIKFIRRATLVTELTTDKDMLDAAIDSISYDSGSGSYSGTDGSTGYRMALDELSKSTSQFKYMVFITDGEDNGYTYSYDDLISESYLADVVVYTIGMGSASESVLRDIADRTGGKYYHATTGTTTDDMQDLTDVFDDIQGETVDKTTDSNYDGISDYYTELINDGNLCLTNTSYELAGCTDVFGEDSADWDGDGLLNGEEIEIVIGSNGQPKIKMKSHPFWVDYDCDGYSDYEEVNVMGTNPLKYTLPYKPEYDELVGDSSIWYYATFLSENYTDNWFDRGVTNVFDWSKTEEAEKVLIDYFYDYASEESVNANVEAIAQQAKKETVISAVHNILKITKNLKGLTDAKTGISELDRKQDKVRNFGYNVFKGLPEIFKCANKDDTETALKLISNTMNDIGAGADLVEDFNDTAEGWLDKAEAFTGTLTSMYKIGKDVLNLMYKDGRMIDLPVPKAFTKFSQKYTKWMGSDAFLGLEKKQVVSIAFDVVDLAADSAELYATYSKLQANTEAYIEYIESIDYISTNGNGVGFIQDAAGEVMLVVLKDGDFMQELVTAIGQKSVKTFIDVGIDLLAKQPYVAAVKAAVDLGISLSGASKLTSAQVETLMADAISDSFISKLDSYITPDGIVYITVSSYDVAIKYMTQLCQSRIYGENVARGFYDVKSVSTWLANIINPLLDKMTTSEMLAEIDGNISKVYSIAASMDLSLSDKLPGYPSSGGGGAW